MRRSEDSTLEKRDNFSRDWSIHYLHKSSGTMLRMDRALAVGNAYEKMLPRNISRSRIYHETAFFFFSFAARGGTGITDNPSKKRSKRFSYRVRGRCWN